jgi:hypothetical protein
MLAHRIKVAIIVQQGVAVLDAVCADDQTGSYTYDQIKISSV